MLGWAAERRPSAGHFTVVGITFPGVLTASAVTGAFATETMAQGFHLVVGAAAVDVVVTSPIDVQGRRVARLASDTRAAGTHARPVGGLAPGVYVARVVAKGPGGTERATQRLVVVR